MATESPAKKTKKERVYLMNINEAVVKAWEGKTLTEIAEAPISALQGLAEWTDAEFAKLGLSCVYELGTWKYFLWARALCKLAATEVEDKREQVSRMNVNNALDKAHEVKHLRDVLALPPSALQGLAPWVDDHLAKLSIKTISQLGTWKFAEWANSIAVLMPLEMELPTIAVPKPASTKTAEKVADAELPAPSSETVADKPGDASSLARAGAEADPEAVNFAEEHCLGDLSVTAHYKLALVDISQNMDKFYVLQMLRGGDKFLFLIRFGRTGTRGKAKVEGPLDTAEEAETMLAAKFKEKTQNPVESVAAGSFAKVDGMYDLIKGDTGVRRSTEGSDGGRLWQYYVDDGVDGKRVGWYDYAQEAAEEVESIHSDWVNNPEGPFHVRSVQSGSFCYEVNFKEMVQTNVTHPNRTQRKIRRNA